MDGEKINAGFLITARTAAILFTGFITFFSLDVGAGQAVKMSSFLMYALPAAVMVVLLLCFWNRSWQCGIAFFGIAVIFTLWFQTWVREDVFLMISMPPAAIGVLFMLAGRSAGKKARRGRPQARGEKPKLLTGPSQIDIGDADKET